jgi:WD40 repeat protein
MLDLHDVRVPINTVAFSPDGSLLAAGCSRGHVQLWETATGTQRARLHGCKYSVSAVFFSPDGATLYAAEWGILAWAVPPRGEGPRVVVAAQAIEAAALSSDGRLLGVCGFFPQSAVVMCDARDGRVLWSEECVGRHASRALAFASNGATLATSTYNGVILVPDANSGTYGEQLLSGIPVKALAFSPDGSHLACAAKGHLFLWQLDPLSEVAHHTTGRTHFLGVAFHPSGEFFATANGDGKVDYWDAATGKHRESFDWKVGKLHDVTFAPDGQRAACCAKSGHIILWDVDL